MMQSIRKSLASLAAAAAVVLAGAAAQAATVAISDGDTINITQNTLYKFESDVDDLAWEGAGSYSFTFIADSNDAPLPMLAVTANITGITGSALIGAYLEWKDALNNVLGSVALGDLGSGFGWLHAGQLGTLFTEPDHLTQTLTLGWTSRKGTIQYSLNVAPVPLPAGGLLLLAGLGGLAVVRRRKAVA